MEFAALIFAGLAGATLTAAAGMVMRDLTDAARARRDLANRLARLALNAAPISLPAFPLRSAR